MEHTYMVSTPPSGEEVPSESVYFVSFQIVKDVVIGDATFLGVSNSGSLLVKIEDPAKEYHDVHQQIADSIDCDIDKIHITAFNKIG